MPHKPPFFPPALGLLIMLAIFALHFIKPLGILFPHPWNYLGLLPIVVGALIKFAADREVQRAGFSPCGHEPYLIERGVFRMSRNPRYLGVVLIAAGLAIWVGSVTPWLVVLTCPLVMYGLFIRHEERQMLHEHGEAYTAYCKRVSRWWGRGLKAGD